MVVALRKQCVSLTPYCPGVATHTCASLLITTERSLKISHDFPIWDVAAHSIITWLTDHCTLVICLAKSENLHMMCFSTNTTPTTIKIGL